MQSTGKVGVGLPSRLSAWILYWALVGNVDFRFAVCIALAVVIGTQLISRVAKSDYFTRGSYPGCR
ncbi:MAG TPA: hypothetical protein VF086_08440 [Propionibacteriaceae bacterium]